MVRTVIKVVSLDSSKERQEAFSLGAKTNLEWSFFSALTDIVHPLRYNAAAAARCSGRSLTKSEIGCYASHFKLWEWLVGSTYDQAIIMEDDIIVNWKILESLAAVECHKYRIDILRLTASYPFKWKLIMHRFLAQHVHLVRIAGVVYSTQAYLITKEAARILVSKYMNITMPIDNMVGQYWKHGIFNYCLFPFPVMDSTSESVIGSARHSMRADRLVDRFVYFANQKLEKFLRAYTELFLTEKHLLGPQVPQNEIFIKLEAR